MKFEVIYRLLCEIYALLLRPLIKKEINNPKSEWDDDLLAILDRLFNYSTVPTEK